MSTIEAERAILYARTIQSARALCTERTKTTERANWSVSTIPSERAITSARTTHLERAPEAEGTIISERAPPGITDMTSTLKLRIRNFQAVADAKLEVQGLTVITGKTNRGKSALIRATAAMLFGLPGDHFVRRGEDWTGGTLLHETETDPLRISWRKVPTNKRKPNLQPLLEINGVEHTKIGRDHKNLTAPHGILELDTAATKLRPQVALQHDPIFLVGENETTAAEVFKLLGRVDVITAAQADERADLLEAERRRKLRTQDLAQAEAHRAELADVPDLNRRLDELRKADEEAGAKTAAFLQQQDQLKELTSLTPTEVPTRPTINDPGRAVRLASQLQELLDLEPQPTPTPPTLKPTPTLEAIELLRALEETEAQLSDLQSTRNGLGLQQTKVLDELEELKRQLGTCPTCGQPLHPGRPEPEAA